MVTSQNKIASSYLVAGQRLPHVYDLVEPRPEEIVLSAVPPLLRPHRITPPPSQQRKRITAQRLVQFARKQAGRRCFPVIAKTRRNSHAPENKKRLRIHHGQRISVARSAWATGLKSYKTSYNDPA